MIDFLITTEGSLPEDMEALLTAVVERALESEGAPAPWTLSISIVGEEEIREANTQFRDRPAVTDVLSFPLLSFSEPAVYPSPEEDPTAYDPESGALCLGDVLLCLPRAEEQAKEYGHSLRRELAFLTAHSMLHLCGYDHEDAQEAAVMEEKQEAILQSLGITREDEDEHR